MHRSIALVLCLTAAGCDGGAAVEHELAAQGFSAISLGARDGGTFAFTASKDGASCTGTVEQSGFAGITRNTEVQSSCSKPPEPARPQREGLAVKSRGLGREIFYERLPALTTSIRVNTFHADLASYAGAALLAAISQNDRGWIAAHGTKTLRHDLVELAKNINGPMLMWKRVDLGPARVLAQGGNREVVAFDLFPTPGNAGVELEVTFVDSRFDGFAFSGPGWTAALEAYAASERSFAALGSWKHVVERGVLPGAGRAGDEIVLSFVYDRYAIRDGKTDIQIRTIHRLPDGTHSKDVDEHEVAVDDEHADEPITYMLTLHGVPEGEHEIEVTAVDRAAPEPIEFTTRVRMNVPPNPDAPQPKPPKQRKR